jgi:CHAT domain-containing protein
VGAAATLEAMRACIPEARVVHLATHGVVSMRSPWLSKIALANGEAIDLAVLGDLNLQADLVTLSACDTAQGAVGKSDEVLGFARGVLAAGARRTLISLWPVSDLATCELMTAFYREIGTGRPVAQALRTAQLHVRGLDAHAVADLAARLAAEGTPVALHRRRDIVRRSIACDAGFAHPSFWAPFMLVGL